MPSKNSALRRVCVVQPILSNYSLPVFLELARYCEVDLFYSPAPQSSGFGEVSLPAVPNLRYIPVKTLKPLGDRWGMYQRGLLGYLVRQRPDALLLSANLRELSFWLATICGRVLGIPVYAHGHGLYKKTQISWAYRRLVQLLLRLVTAYICYAAAVRQSFLAFGFDEKKLAVADNSLINPCQVRPEEKSGAEMGVLFLGRLRADCALESLIDAIARLRESDGLLVRLHIIGAGEEEMRLRGCARNRPWVAFHGAIYHPGKIRQVSLDCFLGCYPGNAGLSIVHMMSLSLPVITHNRLHAHGPEVSFLRNGASGLLYEHSDQASLYCALRSLATDPARVARMRREAFADYQRLSNPSLAQRLWAIVGGGAKLENPPAIAPAVRESANSLHSMLDHTVHQ
jgi:glycosyltransferase involved in cell wall biosynthesis